MVWKPHIWLQENLVEKSITIFVVSFLKDLILKFHGRKEFQISLKNVTNEKKFIISIYLKTLTAQIFHDVRNGENITIDDIKDYLKSEVRKYKWFY